MSAELLAEGIAKSYPKHEVLRACDLRVRRGETVAVHGASGTGKSTLLNILGLLDRPDAGTVSLDGRRIDDLRCAERSRFRGRRMGFVFQAFNLLPDFDVLENVLMAARCAGAPVGRHLAAAGELLARVGLGNHLHAHTGTLSGGERQRVALCRALLLEPEILLADEPTGNLDPATATIVLGEMLELARSRGSCVLIVTHDDNVAERADRVLDLRDGRLHETSIAEAGG